MSRNSWLWIALLVLAAATRLAALNLVPLTPAEAAAALTSLDAVRGAGWPPSLEDGAPLLAMGNAWLFALFGAGDGMARSLPALMGMLLVILPFLWRERLGEWGAVAASLVFLCSPTLLFAARHLEPTTVGLFGAALLLTATVLPRPKADLAAALGLAVGMTGGPAFYDLLLAATVAWSLDRLFSSERAPFSLQGWTRPVVGGVAAAMLISVGLGTRWRGWAGPGAGLAAWLTEWRFWRIRPTFLGMLALYEPIPLLAALLLPPTVVLLLQRQNRFPAWARRVAMTGPMAFLLVVLRPGALPSVVSVAVLPLALWIGYLVRLVTAHIPPKAEGWIALHGGIAFLLWQTALLAIARHTRIELAYASQGLEWLSLFIVFVLQVLLAAAFAMVVPTEMAFAGMGAGIVAVLLAIQVSFAWGIAFVRPTSTAEPLVQEATLPDVWALRQMVDELAVQRGARRDDLHIALLDTSPKMTAVLRWTLRDYAALRRFEHWPDFWADLVITPDAEAFTTSPMAGWQGMSFVAITYPATVRPFCQQLFPPVCPDPLRWYLYRQMDAPSPVEQIILWVQDGS